MFSSSQTQFTAAASVSAMTDIQVSGQRCFEGSRWREAILYYLFGIWGNKDEVTYRPKINFFGDVTLRLINGGYAAYGETELHGSCACEPSQKLTVGHAQLEVENGLVRFVKDDHLKLLVITLDGGAELFLWKGGRRSDLNIASGGIPTAQQWFASQA